MKPLHWMTAFLAALLLTGCAGMKPEDFADTQPEFDVMGYFHGSTQAWGIFQDRSGQIRRQFRVDLNGEMQGDTLVLTEDFFYRDGEQSQRIWRIRKLDEHHYEGRADDVVGIASGVGYGQALNWRYQLMLEVDGKTWKVNFNDWMFLQEDGVLINRATMSKFGLKLGEVTLFFTKAKENSYEKANSTGSGIVSPDHYFARANPSFRRDL